MLVCGGRDFLDVGALNETLDALASVVRVGLIIEGEAPGADTFAAVWAQTRGVDVARYPADWRAHGKAAGPLRNQRMLNEGKPDLVIAFPTARSRGTWDMVSKARYAGIPTWVMPDDRAKIDALGEGVFV